MSKYLNLRFPEKLWNIMEICRTGSIIWSKDGMTILIKYPQFQKEFMSQGKGFFKTDKITSFVRQLNLYGFMKLRGKLGSSRNTDVEEFQNKNFIRHRFDLLRYVSRNTKGCEREDRRRRTKKKRYELKEPILRKRRKRRKRKEEKKLKVQESREEGDSGHLLVHIPSIEQEPLDAEMDLISFINDDNCDGTSKLETTLINLENSQEINEGNLISSSEPVSLAQNWDYDLTDALQPNKIVFQVNKTLDARGAKSISTSKRLELWKSTFSSPEPLKEQMMKESQSYFNTGKGKQFPEWMTRSANGKPQWRSRSSYVNTGDSRAIRLSKMKSSTCTMLNCLPHEDKMNTQVIVPAYPPNGLMNGCSSSSDDDKQTSLVPNGRRSPPPKRMTHTIRKTYWDKIKEVPSGAYQSPYGPLPSSKNGSRNTSTSPTLVNVAKYNFHNGDHNGYGSQICESPASRAAAEGNDALRQIIQDLKSPVAKNFHLHTVWSFNENSDYLYRTAPKVL